ncbi:dihydrolipoyl dehydrogenase [Myxococcota bacterium]|nr:dihydrolipoyl dehydrogenase [Myxococcota bacterium]MBU1381224.1 dihydrolipoyl dehydrogenase [Myxococcota bacterium]MBU1496924.1 dihydrolipoyl dehydrogenase [Myxococcota bacterium]
MEILKTDTLILGGGVAGYVAAIRLGQKGVDTVLVEKQAVGGTCLNRGCIPSKAFISSARKYLAVKNAAVFGITGGENVGIDMAAIQSHKNTVVKKLTQGIEQLLKSYKVKVVKSEGRFTSTNTLEITSENIVVEFKTALISTGSEPVRIPGIVVDGKHIMESDHILDIDYIPESITVLGGGVIGIELGQFFSAIGSKVTVIEAMDQILPGIDEKATRLLGKTLKKMGITVLTSTKLTSATVVDSRVNYTYSGPKGDGEGSSSILLVTVGRKPSLKGSGLNALGLDENARFIEVDDHCRTKVPGVFAAGDVCGGILLAHRASHMAEVAAENIMGGDAVFNPIAIPAVCYSMPEIATTGLDPKQAAEKGIAFKVGTFPYAANGRALAGGDTEGFIQIVSNEETGVIIGAQIVSPEGSELLTELHLAVEKQMKVTDIAHTIHAHPTLSEAIMEAAMSISGGAIHIPGERKK